MTAPLRIAMWSGPRNMSTTMMRSFGSREDTSCVDEPFYAAYLTTTGLTHPMHAEILASQSVDPSEVARQMCDVAFDTTIQYQKQMTHHFLETFPTDWMNKVDHHVFLIRHPARVIASYTRKMDEVSLDAIGFPQQVRIFEQAAAAKQVVPIIIDSDDILTDPENSLRALCKALCIPFDAAMLKWSPGPKPEDGAWAPHWYDAVNKSSGFGPPPGPLPQLPNTHSGILEDALNLYDRLWKRRLLA